MDTVMTVKKDNMKRQRQVKGQQGFTLIEVLMAMVILGIGIFAIVGLQTKNMTYNSGSKKQTEGYTWAMDQVENLLSLQYTDTNLNFRGNPATVGDGHSVSQGPYTVEWDVQNNGTTGGGALGNIDNTKRIHVSVRWNNRQVSQVDYTRVQASF
jgi:prepilin-type N-terminal cleavage/methylation domain-containing protein